MKNFLTPFITSVSYYSDDSYIQLLLITCASGNQGIYTGSDTSQPLEVSPKTNDNLQAPLVTGIDQV